MVTFNPGYWYYSYSSLGPRRLDLLETKVRITFQCRAQITLLPFFIFFFSFLKTVSKPVEPVRPKTTRLHYNVKVWRGWMMSRSWETRLTVSQHKTPSVLYLRSIPSLIEQSSVHHFFKITIYILIFCLWRIFPRDQLHTHKNICIHPNKS